MNGRRDSFCSVFLISWPDDNRITEKTKVFPDPVTQAVMGHLQRIAALNPERKNEGGDGRGIG
jgi:hypothetical protein